MTLNKTSIIFKNLLSNTDKKSEIKIYQEFIQIISNLEKRNLSKEETQSIELQLDTLNLNTKKNKRHISKALREFKTYLNTEFSLITKGYYSALGMSLGMCLGLSFGSLISRTLGISSGLTIGMFIGLLIGRYMDKQAISQGRVI